MADHDAPLLGDETGPAVVAEALPDLRHVVPVARVVGAEGGGDHPSYGVAVVGLLGAHLETHASVTLPRLCTVPPWRSPRWPTAPTSRCSSGRAARSPTAARTWSSAPPTTRPSGGATSCCCRTRPPTQEEAEEWLREFEREFPEARHRTFGIDGTDGTVDDLARVHRARAGGRGVERDDRPGRARAPAAQHRGDVPSAGLRRRLGAADRGGAGRRGRSATTSPS